MLIGIDVGGTFTDGVLFDPVHGKVLQAIKVPSRNEAMQATLLQVLDQLLTGQDAVQIERIVLSTTLVTNLLATAAIEPPALILIPGPGLPYAAYDLFPHSYFVKGTIDFRGRETEKIDPDEIRRVLADIEKQGIDKLAVVGKFSNRNQQQEKAIQAMIAESYPGCEVMLGSEMAGQLNFMRRIVTTYYALSTQSTWFRFVTAIEKALFERGLEQARVDILKADGGTMPLLKSKQKPCETVFSGPAASTMGARALLGNKANAVVLDIGGTTTDLSLLLDGQALHASRGAVINGRYTQIKSISTRSLALGGDSPILVEADQSIRIAAQRQDQAACFNGSEATVIDVFNSKYQLGIGVQSKSDWKLQMLAEQAGLSLSDLLSSIENQVINKLTASIQEMFQEWENEPAYRVWEVVHQRRFELEQIIGIGAAAPAIVPVLAERLRVKHFIHEYSPVANAVGAALARPTLSLNLHIDTQNGYYSTDLEGVHGTVQKGKAMQIKDAQNLARDVLEKVAAEKDMAAYANEAVFFQEEQFNIIRGWDSSGKIFEIGIQIVPGFIAAFKEGSI